MGEPLKIYSGESAVVAKLEVRAPGSYEFEVDLRGNALVSTIFVKALNGATIAAVWKDFNPLTDDRYTVDTYPSVADGYNRRFIAQATHGVAVLEITVTGGSPEFGVFVTANALVGNFASPDAVQQVDGTITTTSEGVSTPKNSTAVTSATPATETSFTLATVKRFRFTNRGKCMLRYAFASGGTNDGSDYATLAPNATAEETGILDANITVYVRSPAASERIEVVSWT